MQIHLNMLFLAIAISHTLALTFIMSLSLPLCLNFIVVSKVILSGLWLF